MIRKQHPSYSARSIPVRKPEPKQNSSPKVVSVPVQFISSKQPQTKATKPLLSINSAAISIQKVFRSFLVRKCISKISSINTDVNEIERRINDVETVDLIRNDPKERLRVNETLMSLLFKLDSIRGIDSGVRDLRKTVTKKAIALQEKIDSIAQSNDSVVDNCDSVNMVTESQFPTQCFKNEEVVKEVVQNCDSVNVNQVTESQFPTESVENEEVGKEAVENCDSVKFVQGSKVLEKLMDDNERMMKLINQISERNELQTRMINSLSRRVEQLEKGFIENQLTKKKKTNDGLRKNRDDFYF